MEGTPAGSAPHVVMPQCPHVRRCCWYSVTCGLGGGSSTTWCRHGSGSLPANGSPQRR